MSSGSQEKVSEVREEFARALRQFQGLSASFFRAAAAQVGITATDMQVIDLLESTGPATAGQLADLTGLTTGAITGMLNRLEKAGFVRRERDPNDGRRVIVRLEKGGGEMQRVGLIFASLEKAWNELASPYDDEQIAFFLEFLKRSNELSRREIIRLREVPAGEEEIFSAPLAGVESARLIIPAGISRLTIRADEAMDALYHASFAGPAPDVKTRDGVVTIRYPRGLWLRSSGQRGAEIALSVAVPWHIVIQGGASDITARLGGLNLAGLEFKGGMSMIRLELPRPQDVVPIRISGGASEIIVRRPAGAAARVHLKGWASEFVFDDQTFSDLGNNVRMQSADFDPTAPYFDIEVASSASMVTITSA